MGVFVIAPCMHGGTHIRACSDLPAGKLDTDPGTCSHVQDQGSGEGHVHSYD